MPTNRLRSEGARLLTRALEAQENGRTAEAHELTMQAAQCLEDAMSVEQLRGTSTRLATRPVRAQSAR